MLYDLLSEEGSGIGVVDATGGEEMALDHISNDENSVSWQQTRDIHAQYWKDVAPYYILRNSVMDGMLKGTKLYLTVGKNAYTISE